MEGENWQEAKEGTPQSGDISPLPTNIYIDPLDKQMSESGIEMSLAFSHGVPLIRILGGEDGIFLGSNQPLCPHEVVKQKITVRKRAANITKKPSGFRRGQCAPRGQ
jgi:retron-type reverse transcriptase